MKNNIAPYLMNTWPFVGVYSRRNITNVLISTGVGKLWAEEKYMLGKTVVTVPTTGLLAILLEKAWNSIQYEKLSQQRKHNFRKGKGGVCISLIHVPMTIIAITTGINLWGTYYW